MTQGAFSEFFLDNKIAPLEVKTTSNIINAQSTLVSCLYQGAVAELKRELEEGLGLWRAQLLAAQVRTSLTSLVVRIVMMVIMLNKTVILLTISQAESMNIL